MDDNPVGRKEHTDIHCIPAETLPSSPDTQDNTLENSSKNKVHKVIK